MKPEIYPHMIYRHFKGDLYQTVDLATDTRTDEDVVIYRRLATGELWTRPYKEFFGMAWHENKQVPRFMAVDIRDIDKEYSKSIPHDLVK